MRESFAVVDGRLARVEERLAKLEQRVEHLEHEMELVHVRLGVIEEVLRDGRSRHASGAAIRINIDRMRTHDVHFDSADAQLAELEERVTLLEAKTFTKA